MMAQKSEKVLTNRNDGIQHLVGETESVLNAATILISALVGLGLQELVDEVPVGPVKLNTVKTSRNRIERRVLVVLQDEMD